MADGPTEDLPTALGPDLTDVPGVVESILGEPVPPDAQLPEPVTDPASPAPSTARSLGPDLSAESLSDLGRDFCELLDEIDAALEDRRERIQRCIDNYDMQPNTATQGPAPFSAKTCSELTKSKVDQAKARLVGAILAEDSPIHIVPIDVSGQQEEGVDREAQAAAAERFINSYFREIIGARRFLDLKTTKTAKTGSGVTYDTWAESSETIRYFDPAGDEVEDTIEDAAITTSLIPFKYFFLWPLTINDWQRDYEVIGHHTPMSKFRFQSKLRELDVDTSIIDEITGVDVQEVEDEDELESRQVDTSAVSKPRYLLTELWFHGENAHLPAGKYQVFLHRDTRRCLKVLYNPFHCQEHPYREFIWKYIDDFALGEGLAEELFFAHHTATTLDNLELDSLKVNTADVLKVRENSPADTFNSEIYPGVIWRVADPEDVTPMRLGGEPSSLYTAKEGNYRRAATISGMPNVLEGSGDPTMKSGADASSVMALISEGSKKIQDTGYNIMDAFAREVEFWFELIQQYAPAGLFARRISRSAARFMEAMKYEPPAGRFRDFFKVEIRAPSAALNRETHKQHLMILNNLASEFLAFLDKYGTEVYMQQNPVLIQELKRDIFECKAAIIRAMFRIHEQEGLVEKLPALRDPTPMEEVVLGLQQQIQQYAGQLDQVSFENRVLTLSRDYIAQGVDPAAAEQRALMETQTAMAEVQQGQAAAGAVQSQQGAPA